MSRATAVIQTDIPSAMADMRPNLLFGRLTAAPESRRSFGYLIAPHKWSAGGEHLSQRSSNQNDCSTFPS